MHNPAQAKDPGSYILILFLEERRNIQVGRAGRMDFAPGYYLYTGSALGKGGIKARLGRHLSAPARLHWHIDALRACARPAACGWVVHPQERECAWIAALATLETVDFPFAGFGAGDCRKDCPAHLAYLSDWSGVKTALGLIRTLEMKQNVHFHTAVLDNNHTLC